MLDILQTIFDLVKNFFDGIWQFVTSGIYDLFTWSFAQIVESLTIAALDFILWALPFAWDVAQNIILDMQLDAILQSAWSNLDSQILGLASLLRIPDVVSLLMSASITKFVLRFIPFV